MYTVEMNLAGRLLRLETGDLAKQASGAVMVRYGDTMVLVTCVGAEKPREGIDFFPLTVDYEEKLYAAGKIPGSWFRKEGRPTDKCILTSRLIDRPLRPLFPEGWRNDVQVIATVMSADQENDPDIPALIGASAALTISDVPFSGPIAAVRIGLVDGNFTVNPTIAQREKSTLDLVVAGTKKAVTMIEAGAEQVSEAEMFKAIQFAHNVIKDLCDLQEQLQKVSGKPKREVPASKPDAELEEIMKKHFTPEIDRLLSILDKKEQKKAEDALDEAFLLKTLESYPEETRVRIQTLLEDESRTDFSDIKDALLEERFRVMIVEQKKRPDGRQFNQVRPIHGIAGFLTRTHGSAIFTRGQTQVVATVTLGGPGEEQTLDGLLPEETKRFLLHYYFPPYSVGEVKPMRGPGRREIGHGALAERALSYLLPSEEEFPYTMRIVCEAIESNGSTSMASVCSGSLALFDAGVPMKKHVAGIAMGLVHHGNNYAVLTDIQGLEDHLGEMDFKIAGTRDGITAMQLDIKLTGVEMEVLERAISQSREARMQILDIMERVLAAPRADLSKFAPRILTILINPDKIKDVIGPGGKMIHKITDQTGVEIEIEDDGRVFIVTPNLEAAEKAKQMIENITQEAEPGKIYHGRVTRLMNFGAFVEIFPGREGLVHISQIGPGHVERVEDALKVGDEVDVKVMKIDDQGRVNLTIKGLNIDGPQPDDNRGPRPNGGHKRRFDGDRDKNRRRDREPARKSSFRR